MIFLGKIVKIRGNKGEVVVAPSPDLFLHSLSNGEVVVLQSAKYKKEKEIDYLKEIRGAPVFKFKDINTINDAFKVVGYSIYANKTDAQETDSGIINFMVKDLQGHMWGCVKNIENPGVNPLLEVETPEGDMIDVPFTDSIVKEIDQERKVILIDPPEGLKDLNKS
ncbi:MAG: ribosome maturation factor RimM [Candidatus Aminicenantes bacterium]